MIEWPDSLIEEVARRKCILFLGAGVSVNSVGKDGKRPPTWLAFLEKCLEDCSGAKAHIKKLIKEGDLLTACELLKARLAENWTPLLVASFSEPEYKASPLHEALFQLDVRLVLTPNFDKIYDVYAQSITHGSTVLKTYYDADTPLVIRNNQRAIIKVHGTIDEPSKMIFTREDYARVREISRSFQALIDALFLTNTFLFVGSSFKDPDLRLFLEQHAYAHPTAPPHFMMTPKGEIHSDLDESVHRNMKVRLLRYDPADGHQELLDSVQQLGALADAERELIAARQDW